VNDLAGAIERYQATWVELTPSVAALLDLDLVPVTFVNSYGLSETAITNIIASPMSTEFVNDIGQPVNCRCWVVDAKDHHILAPLGAIGELLME